MPKVTIDKETFKALASDTRLEILKALDGRKMNLSELSRKTGLSKTTILEHLNKLVEADLVKKIEREGHKWTYYKLSWKGSSLLHPENTKIVITFCLSFLLLFAGISQLIIYGNGFVFTATIDSSNPTSEFAMAPDKAAEEGAGGWNVSEECMMRYAQSLARNKTLLKMAPKNVHISLGEINESTPSFGDDLENDSNRSMAKLSMDIFYQDPFYLYLGLTLIILSVATSIYSFRTLWKRKSLI